MDWNPGSRGNLHGSDDGGDPAGSLDPWGPPRGQTWFSSLENAQKKKSHMYRFWIRNKSLWELLLLVFFLLIRK